MATILLQAAGAFLGGFLGPMGVTFGKAAGALAGYMIDRAIVGSTQRFEGPRLSGQRLSSAEEGTPIARVYGTARVTGNLIWATRFEEQARTTRRGFKGGPRTTTYHYLANAAFALCEGEIAGIRRVWVDGRELDQETVTIRVHRGTQDQAPDPLIEAKQGTGNAPAYRGLAYAVVERMPLDDYGNRLPQFHFEVLRPVGRLHRHVRSVALIPGATEYGLATEVVTLSPTPGETRPLNRNVLTAGSDIIASLDELQALCPNLEDVSLVVSWFGDDLRAGNCAIRPMVTENQLGDVSRAWRVGGLERHQVPEVSRVDDVAAYGGTPADFSVMEAIAEIRARGLKVTLHPFIMMDVPAENELPDPHGGSEQAAYPWRGRITCHPGPQQAGSADKSAAARTQVEAFLGNAEPDDFSTGTGTILFNGNPLDWGFRRFILHHAHLAAAAGGVDAFLIGSELRGLTRLRDGANAFPFVEALCALTDELRAVLGASTKITYGADWTEYFGHQPADGSGDVYFHLDPLWAHDEIGAVAIHNYMPLSDWRDEDHRGGNPDGFAEPYDRAGLASQVAGGEGYDWYYESMSDRLARQRSPITDGQGKPWVFRYKDLISWWQNQHFDRPGGTEAAMPTAWVPGSKPIWFTELGCPAVDKGPNQPNVFPDPKSSENAAPYFSGGGRSDLAQRRFIETHQAHWDPAHPDFVGAKNPHSHLYAGRMVDAGRVTLWAWDARAFPSFPTRREVWADGDNWQLGHWLTGRLAGVALSDLIDAVMEDHRLPPAETDAVAAALTGYVVDDPTTARATLDPLAELFGLAVHERDGHLVFGSEARGVPAIEPEEFVVPETGPILERTRTPDHELPGEAELGFRDPFLDYQAAVARVARLDPEAAGLAGFALPAVLDGGLARSLLEDWLARQWAGRETIAFSLAPTRREIGIGKLVAPQGELKEYLVTRIDDGLERRIKARRILRVGAARWQPVPPPARPAEIAGAAVPYVRFLDLPMGPQSQRPEDQLRVAVRARPWRTHLVLASPEDAGLAHRATIAAPASMGRLTSALPGGFEGRIDRAASLEVELFQGELESVTRVQMLNGANAATILSDSGNWEVVQFETAEETAQNHWTLRGPLRGQLGTGDAMASGAAQGAEFVLLGPPVVAAGLQVSEIGLQLNWRVVASGTDIDGWTTATASLAGGVRALLPLSPVHVRLRRQSGDAVVSWIRRGRVDADGWSGLDIPLSEAVEAYRVEYSLPSGPVRRSFDVNAPEHAYSLGQMEADFGTLPDEIEVTVCQISQAIGPGLPATRHFQL